MNIHKLKLLELNFQVLRPITNLPFYHGIHWSALLRELLKRQNLTELSQTLWLQTVETAIFEYKEGDQIKLGLTFPSNLAPQVEKLLNNLNNHSHLKGHFIPSVTVKLIGTTCRVTGKPLTPKEAQPLTEAKLHSEIEKLQNLNTFTLLFYSPLRLKRPEGYKTEGHTYIDQEFFNMKFDSNPLKYLFSKVRLIDQVPDLSKLRIERTELLWIDIPYGDSKTLGGVVGAVTVKGKPNLTQAKFIVLSQYLGIGKNPSFGFGFFTIPELESVRTIKPLSRGVTLTSRLTENSNNPAPSEFLSEQLKRASKYWTLHLREDLRKLTLEQAISKVLNSDLLKALFPSEPLLRTLGISSDQQKVQNTKEWSRLLSLDDEYGYSLFLTANTKQAYSEGDHLVVIDRQDKRERIPLSQVARVYILGSSNFSYSLVNKALSKGIPIAFLDLFGKPKGFLFPESYTHQDMVELQIEKIRQREFCLSFAKEIVTAKIHNSSVILRRHSLETDPLGELIDQAEKAKDLDSLRGYEGMASRIYFEALSKLTTPFEFSGRTYHPPLDAINSMLSFGYTLLYYRIAAALKLHRLNPRLGFYHRGRGSHYSLASDLLEELRHISERVTLSLIHLRQITHEDFVETKEGFPIKLTYEGLLKYLKRFEKLMATKTLYYQDKPLTYNEYIDRMVINLIKALKDESPYKALRIR